MRVERTGVYAIVALVIIVVLAVGLYSFREDLVKFFSKPKIIEEGDCVDVNYIMKYASNGTMIDTSYESVAKEYGIYDENKTYQPLKMFVSLNTSNILPKGYEDYSPYLDGEIIKEFIENLIGMKEGEKKTFTIEDAFGVKPKVGDIINLSTYFANIGYTYNKTYLFRIVEIRKNATMPSDYRNLFGNKSTTLYVLREEWYKVGEILPEEINPYPSWKNCAKVTKVNETKMWFYITPTTKINQNFTWIEFNQSIKGRVKFPDNKSRIINITNDTITILISPEINDIVTIEFYSHLFPIDYKVENITSDKINASYISQDGNKTYIEFNRIITIKRNQSRNITKEVPAPTLSLLFSMIKYTDPDFPLSLHKLAGEDITFEVKIEKIYKTSKES